MAKKRTHEGYVAEIAIKNPTVKVLGTYVNANTPILHHCIIHDIFWETIPDRVLRGCGCEECRKEKYHKSRCRTHEQYVKAVFEVAPHIRVIGKYVDARTPILHYCQIHDVLWSALPNNILCGHGCYECGKEKIGDKNRKGYSQYVAEVAIENPNIEVIGTYISADTPIMHRCKIDDYIWLARPANVLHGKGCPKCAGNLKLTHNEYTEKLSVINSNIIPIEEYVDSHTHILHRCLIDNHIWSIQPSSALQGYGCPKCAGNAKKTHEEYKYELAIKNPTLEVLEEYMGANTPILHRCKIDGYEWRVPPTRALTCCGCPQCRESRGEKSIRQWLEAHNIIYKYQHTFDNCRDKKVLPFDFYITHLNVIVEFDGLQHFEPVDFAGKGEEWALEHFKMVQHHDQIKNDYCKNNNISLLRISYWTNIEEELEKFFIHLI